MMWSQSLSYNKKLEYFNKGTLRSFIWDRVRVNEGK